MQLAFQHKMDVLKKKINFFYYKIDLKSIIDFKSNRWPLNRFRIESWGAKRFPPLVLTPYTSNSHTAYNWTSCIHPNEVKTCQTEIFTIQINLKAYFHQPGGQQKLTYRSIKKEKTVTYSLRKFLLQTWIM